MSKVSTFNISSKIPQAFIWRRLHSLAGLWLVFYLFEHLLVNSQAALLFENQEGQFVRMVNAIHDLPYLQAVEIIFLGIPFFIHIVWGVQYLVTGKVNSLPSDGTKPSLTEYRRNHAYTWQRITSWILLIGIIAHVVHMRFFDYPITSQWHGRTVYLVTLDSDAKVNGLARRMGVPLYEANEISTPQWADFLKKRPERAHQKVAIVENKGTAFLFILKNVFSNPALVILYSILVIASAYHGFNGLWTFLITWGVTLTRRSQLAAEYLSWGLMILVIFLGLMAAIGTYFVTLT